MAAVSERIHGLRRPGASLLKKTLPARPNDKALSRKAVPVEKTTTASNTSSNTNTNTSISEPQKDLPPPPPHVAVAVAPVASQSQSQLPPRGSSLNPDGRNDSYNNSTERPQGRPPGTQEKPQITQSNLLAPHPPPHARPISEAPSISTFIPDPEPEPEHSLYESLPISGDLIIDGQKTPDTESSTSNNTNTHRNWTPPLPDPVVVAPLTRVHYGCFQGHRNMLAANNVWYATACMTCRKLDQEERHRCTFCGLRVCASCFERLQKAKNRSLSVFGL